ncbi:MAG: glycogen synthase GlgA [Gemmataceae bacterium]|nr:glycogen synthase GlgA [Gemmataceae bacterium]
MRIALASSEVVGFAKTGGLADVVGSLPPALEKLGHQAAVFLPLYNSVRQKVALQATPHRLRVLVGDEWVEGGIQQAKIPGSQVPVYLIENPALFERDNAAFGRGIYQFASSDGWKKDYPDNSARYLFFCRAVLQALPLLNFWPEVLHCNDWQTGLIPVLLKKQFASADNQELAEKYRRIRTLMTIHNIAYQGNFWKEDMNMCRLDWRLFNPSGVEFNDCLSFLKAGMVFADRLNTVSPTYAKEIQTPYFGCGLQGVLLERSADLSGIVNGIDYQSWNPATDPELPAHFDALLIDPGKAACKEALQKEFHLPVDPRAPLAGMVARLVEQKGLELIAEAGGRLLATGMQFVVLGEGDSRYHLALENLRREFPSQVALQFGFNEGLAHRIEAGADLFLMPSLYEPSGLNQLYSMRYGALPLVRGTGGLADTVTDTKEKTLANGTATGFRFQAYSPEALVETLQRALSLYRNHPATWRQVQINAMKQDWSWERSAREYQDLYLQMANSLH